MGNALHQRLSESERKLRRGGSRPGRVRAFNLRWREQFNRSAFTELTARQVKR